MNRLLSNAKSLLPWRVRNFIREVHRYFVFRQAMRRFLKSPESSIQPENPLIKDLVYGWGNESWSAQDGYLAGCIEHALTADGPILECGSGLSTILVGAIAKARGIDHWAPEWAAKLQQYLSKYQIDSVVLCARPLKDYGDFSWYDPPLESMPESFPLVLCDGLPGSTKGGRFGLVPVMRARLKPGCIILHRRCQPQGRTGNRKKLAGLSWRVY